MKLSKATKKAIEGEIAHNEKMIKALKLNDRYNLLPSFIDKLSELQGFLKV